MSIDIKDAVTQLEEMFCKINTQVFGDRARAKWPVIINRCFHRQSVSYEYQYPEAFFTNLQFQLRILFPYELIKSKSNRLILVKLIIDKRISGEIDTFTYHFGMFLINRNLHHREKEDFSESSIGKKRAEFVQTLPISYFLSEDDFISAIWSQLIEYRGTETREYQRNPFLKNVRILFSNEQYASVTGVSYFSDVTWVEPISGKLDLECRKWSEENDPMAPIRIPEGWVQGAIVLKNESSGLRHYVESVPVHAGSAMQVKFGNGWIDGRYEWSFDGKNKIQVHCNDDVVYISEGHQVRVRG
ncbi:MAG: hypothetical protein P4L49_07125 [Desulfosporosinus sp.]|nr:hypothetical protein [Desulfosporosinus sp.]